MDPYMGKEILGQFRILEKIGQGGMGSVYRAEQPSMDRLVAVKILHPRLASRPDLVTRFKREARAMSRLTHPNTVRVYLYGELEIGGALYIVMEFLEGADLMRSLRKEGPFEVARAARIMAQVCGALEEAHKLAIVHRDLKPENVLLTTQGGIPDFPKVLDFGLAKIRDVGSHRVGGPILTQQGMVFGTPEFMSPEQARGEELDGKTDIYSLGVILYELLSGKLPFKAQNPMDYIGHHIKTPPIPIHERAPDRGFPKALWEVLGRSLLKERDKRYASAKEMGDALLELADHVSPRASTLFSAGSAAPDEPTSAPPMPTPSPSTPAKAAERTAPVAKPPLAKPPASDDATKPTLRAAPAPKPAAAAPATVAAGPSKNLVYALIAVIAVLALALVAMLATRSPGPPSEPRPSATLERPPV